MKINGVYTKATDAIMIFFSFLIILCFVGVIAGLVIMWLWNWLIPDIFNGPTITWVQGWGIAVLSSMLFNKNASASKQK